MDSAHPDRPWRPRAPAREEGVPCEQSLDEEQRQPEYCSPSARSPPRSASPPVTPPRRRGRRRPAAARPQEVAPSPPPPGRAGSGTASSTSSTSPSTTCTSSGTTRTSRPTSSRCRRCCNFLKSNGTVLLEHAHAAHRPHRRGQPGDLLRPVRRPPRPADEQHVPHLQARTGPWIRHLVRLLDLADHRHHERPGPVDQRHAAVDGVLAHRAGDAGTPDSRSRPEPWVAFNKAGCSVGDVLHREHGAREHRRHPDRVRPAAEGTPAAVRSTRPAPYIGEAVHCGLGDATCENAEGRAARQPAARRTSRDRRPSRRCSATSTSRRCWRRTRTRPRRYRVDRRGRQPRGPRQPRDRRLPRATRLPRLQPDRHPEPRRAGGRCRRPASR